MSILKKYSETDVLTAARQRIEFAFDKFEKIYISFSGGKDSTTMLHLVMDEAIKRNRRVGVLIIDLEAQYHITVEHMALCMEKYKDYIEPFWVCLPMSLRNAVSNFDPRWICWDPDKKDIWVREKPETCVSEETDLPFFRRAMEFEEFMVEFGIWYGNGALTGAFVGIRADESLNRFRTIASRKKIMFEGKQWTTQVDGTNLYNVYPVYDWRVSDLWRYHYLNPTKPYNKVYDLMFRAGLTPAQMRLCQPYGDDQRRGLWLYHILEPQTWSKIVARVNGANAGALYVVETGNASGYQTINLPEGHTWKSFSNLLLGSMPEKTRQHYLAKFRVYVKWWTNRGYADGLPDEVPKVLEAKRLAPSYRRICKALLRNDYWCKGLGFSQPKSPAYQEYVRQKKEARLGA
jgi:predicted phosphoadenosine phosphosulfate sulfurtransferase